MREYQTTGIIRISSGYIGLDKRQADARSPRVKPTNTAGVYEVVESIEFKAGEKIRLDTPDKAVLDRMQDLTEKQPEPEKPAAPKAPSQPKKARAKK